LALTTDLVGILRGTDLLSTAPAAELEVLAAGSRVRTFRRGQVVFTAGDPGETVMVVVSGRVKAVS
jgi:CRP/FNR family cyclic AMP-dependent transcriptional regulator